MNFLKLFKNPALIVAHRGARSIAPENTLFALEKSIGRSDFIEVDIQLSSDGVAVIMHDDTLERTTNVSEIDSFLPKKPYRVCDFTLEELGRLDYGSWFNKDYSNEPLLTLRDTLEFIKRTKAYINLEIKDIHESFSDEMVVSIVIAEIKRADVEDNILISSFRHEYLELFKAKLPKIPTAALVECKHPENLTLYLNKIKVDAYFMSNELVDKEIVKEVKKAGFYVGVYTINDTKRAEELFDIGVNCIFSDRLYDMYISK